MSNVQEENGSSIFSRSVLLQILAVVLAFTLLVFLSSWFMDDIESRHLTSGMEAALNDTEINITADLKELETLLHYISETIRLMIVRGYSFDKVSEYITDVTSYIIFDDERLKDYTTGVYGLFDAFDGRFHDGTGWVPGAGYEAEDRPWYKAAVLANGNITVTEPYMSMAFPGTHTITFVRRIFSDEGTGGLPAHPLGIVCLDVQVERVRGFTANTYFAESGYVLLLNRRLEILAHPNKALWGKPLRDIDSNYTALMDDLVLGKPVVERRMKNYLKEPSVVSFRQLNNGWYIGMVILEDEYFKEMKQMRLIFIIVGVALAALFITIILRLSAVRLELQSVRGEVGMSTREHEIFTLLLTDLSIRQIANKLELTQSGVNFHIRKIYKKLGVQSRTELLAKFAQKN